MARQCAGVAALLLAGSASAEMSDTLYPSYVSAAKCVGGCLPWRNLSANATIQQSVDSMWIAGEPPTDAGALCAIPAAAVDGARDPKTGKFSGHCPLNNGWNGNLLCNASTSSFYGPICACADSNATTGFSFMTCTETHSVAEQINLQIASADTVVASFVTFEGAYISPWPAQAQLRLASRRRRNPSLLRADGGDGDDGGDDGGDPSPHPWQKLRGVSHVYESAHNVSDVTCYGPGGKGTLPDAADCVPRNYTMGFVRFAQLAPRDTYEYRVRGGAASEVAAATGNDEHGWSDIFGFRALYGGAGDAGDASMPTRVAIYGDMGNTPHNNMANLRDDCAAGTVDAIVHLGDHCYDIGFGNDRHGDAYMNAFQPTIASCPWLPVIGNHESTSGGSGDRVDASTEEHYLNQTWGIVWDDDNGGGGGDAAAAHEEGGSKVAAPPLASTANTSLGHLLTRAAYLGAGSHGAARSRPSRTSQWSSVDIGLIHFAILDLGPGPPPVFVGEQVRWLEADLAAAHANRAAVPWIVVGSHYPLYSASFEAPDPDRAVHGRGGGVGNASTATIGADASLAWYLGEAAERERGGQPWAELPSFERCSDAQKDGAAPCPTVADAVALTMSTLEPLLNRYGVDLYAAGHVHSYSVSWPILGGAVARRSFDDPEGTVHLLEGNGGVPGQCDAGNSVHECGGLPANESLYRICGSGCNYGRLIATNASVLQYEHVENPTGKVTDSWAIRKL